MLIRMSNGPRNFNLKEQGRCTEMGGKTDIDENKLMMKNKS